MQPLFPAIAEEIRRMREADVALRNEVLRSDGEGDPSVDVRNTKRMKEIVQQIEWPTKSKVGEEASHAAWLLVQPADREVAFQEQCLGLLKEAPPDEVHKHDIAYLEDRVRVNTGELQ